MFTEQAEWKTNLFSKPGEPRLLLKSRERGIGKKKGKRQSKSVSKFQLFALIPSVLKRYKISNDLAVSLQFCEMDHVVKKIAFLEIQSTSQGTEKACPRGWAKGSCCVPHQHQFSFPFAPTSEPAELTPPFKIEVSERVSFQPLGLVFP